MSAPRHLAGLGPGRHPPMQAGWIDAPHHHVALGDLPLESGEAIRDCTVSYVVHGPQDAPGVPAAGVPVVLALSAVASHRDLSKALLPCGRLRAMPSRARSWLKARRLLLKLRPCRTSRL